MPAVPRLTIPPTAGALTKAAWVSAKLILSKLPLLNRSMALGLRSLLDISILADSKLPDRCTAGGITKTEDLVMERQVLSVPLVLRHMSFLLFLLKTALDSRLFPQKEVIPVG